MPQTTNPRWWTLAQILVWILLQFELSPQDAEQYCNGLKPETIEMALNTLVGALFNALYGVAEGMPRVIARVPRGRGYENLATLFPLLPSLDLGASAALRNELRQFIRQQPDIEFNPTWGRWTWPVCVSAAPAAPMPSESAVADEAKPIPNSAVGPEESQSNSIAASTPARPARAINFGSDPAVAYAIRAIKPRKPAAPDATPTLGAAIEPVSGGLPARSGETEAPGSEPAAREPVPGPEARDEPPMVQLTYAQLAVRWKCSPEAARHRAARRHLPRTRGSDGKTLVAVSPQEFVCQPPSARSPSDDRPVNARSPDGDRPVNARSPVPSIEPEPRVEPTPPPKPTGEVGDQARGPQQTRELASVDVQRQPQPQPPVLKLSGKQWVPVARARRPVELHAMGITGASEALAKESETAPDCAKPLTARYIEKLLRELGTFLKAHRGSKQRPK